jgi:hypothetical protein
MSASLKFDGSISVGGIGSGVFVWQPDITNNANIYSRHNCVRCTILTATASKNKKKSKNYFVICPNCESTIFNVIYAVLILKRPLAREFCWKFHSFVVFTAFREAYDVKMFFETRQIELLKEEEA